MLSLFWQRGDFGRGGGKTRPLQTREDKFAPALEIPTNDVRMQSSVKDSTAENKYENLLPQPPPIP